MHKHWRLKNRIRGRFNKDFSLWIRGPEGIVRYKKNRRSKILWQCLFKKFSFTSTQFYGVFGKHVSQYTDFQQPPSTYRVGIRKAKSNSCALGFTKSLFTVVIAGHYRTNPLSAVPDWRRCRNADAGLTRRINGKTNNAGLTFTAAFRYSGIYQYLVNIVKNFVDEPTLSRKKCEIITLNITVV
jgi:hypothetical protein